MPPGQRAGTPSAMGTHTCTDKGNHLGPESGLGGQLRVTTSCTLTCMAAVLLPLGLTTTVASARRSLLASSWFRFSERAPHPDACGAGPAACSMVEAPSAESHPSALLCNEDPFPLVSVAFTMEHFANLSLIRNIHVLPSAITSRKIITTIQSSPRIHSTSKPCCLGHASSSEEERDFPPNRWTQPRSEKRIFWGTIMILLLLQPQSFRPRPGAG